MNNLDSMRFIVGRFSSFSSEIELFLTSFYRLLLNQLSFPLLFLGVSSLVFDKSGEHPRYHSRHLGLDYGSQFL